MSIYWRNGWAHGRKVIGGIERRRSFNTRVKREAETAHAKWIAEFETGPAQKDTSFREAVDLFTEHHLGTLKRSSQQRYLVSLLNLTPRFEWFALKDITRGELAKFVSGRRKDGVTDSTIIRDLACLSSVFTIAADFEKADANPVLPFLRAQKRRGALVNAQPETRYLSHAEELAVLTYAADLARAPDAIRAHEKWMIAAAFAAYIDTGMRAQELLAMRWAWIDMAKLEITVPADATKALKERQIPILPRLERLLLAMPKNAHSDLVFWRTAAGRGFNDLNHTFQRYAAAVGIHDVSVHDLRRTCGCRLLQDHKVAMTIVSKWLGHASVVTTEKIYAFLKVENLHDAVGTIRERENLLPQLNAALSEPKFGFVSKKAQSAAHDDSTAIELKAENAIDAMKS